jgi:DNA transformation protein and related proteins
MATSQDTVDFIVDQLGDLPAIRARKMFGEYAVYCDDKVVGLVCDDQLFVKKTPAGAALLGAEAEEGPPYTGAKPAFVIDADVLEDRDRLSELVKASADALPAPKPRKPKKPKKPKKPRKPREKKAT